MNQMVRIFALFVLTFLLALYAYAIGQHSWKFNEIPVFYLVVVYAHLVQIIAFIPAKIFNTEKFYDLTGSLTFISTTLILYFVR